MSRTPHYTRALCFVLLFSFAPLFLFSAKGGTDRVWWDGTKDSENAPPGKLLSDNAGWWGESVLTGADYAYEQPLNNLADRLQDKPGTFGRRLLDGQMGGNWWVPVGMQDRPLVVVFDFKRQCVFRELDVISQSENAGLKVEARANSNDAWQMVYELSREKSPKSYMYRLPLKADAKGRYLRLTVDHGNLTYLNEVYVWGDQDKNDATPEAINPIFRAALPTGNKGSDLQSLPGIAKTIYSRKRFDDWRRKLGTLADQSAVWSLVPMWEAISTAPILPTPDKIVRRVPMTLARNEGGWAALALSGTNADAPRNVTVSLGAFHRVGGDESGGFEAVSGTLRVAGLIDSRLWGLQVGPLFEADNKLSPSLMRRYLSNSAQIADFPRLTLAPGNSVICWLTVETKNAAPGTYEAELTCSDGGRVTVSAEVLDVTLPHPFHWLESWSNATSQSPFVYGDRQSREVSYKQSFGATTWMGFPTPGSDAALARSRGLSQFQVNALPATGLGGPNDEKVIGDHIAALVKQATNLGLTYDDWFVELWDEPGLGNAERFGRYASLIRKADPRVRIYCNPGFWEKSGLAADGPVYAALKDWYNADVDISVPHNQLLDHLEARQKLFDAPHWIRAFYFVGSHLAKSENKAEIWRFRQLAWDAIHAGYNGWGIYSYFAPRGDPWNDFDGSIFENVQDYELVYPGPRGPIPTRESESVRASWQDYCLLTLLQGRGKQAGVKSLMQSYADGDAFESLHTKALRIAAKP